MATFNQNLETIAQGVYGKDVRQAIHDAIEQNREALGDDITTAQIDAKFNNMYVGIIGSVSVLNVSSGASVIGNTLVFEGSE